MPCCVLSPGPVLCLHPESGEMKTRPLKSPLARTGLLLSLCLVASLPTTGAKPVEIDLTVSEGKITAAGRTGSALRVNGQIPGPVLRFREGDEALIRLHNALEDESTLMHWHGLLVPNSEDGVPDLTTPPVPPGGTHTYRFPLTHPGTYWYHSHVGLQEQRGVYGAIVVDPAKPENDPPDRELVLVLSDWTHEAPEEVMRNLMRGDHWYGIRKGNAPSLWGTIQAGALAETFDRTRLRMPAMDVSDVAYDAFWINGSPQGFESAKPGEEIRLRVINAAASTYFYLGSGTGPMRIEAADGMPVEPVPTERLLIGIGETYDLRVRIPPIRCPRGIPGHRAGRIRVRLPVAGGARGSCRSADARSRHPEARPLPDGIHPGGGSR